MKAAFFDIGGVVIRDIGLKTSLFRAFHPVPQDVVWDTLNTDVLTACKGGVPLADCWRAMAKKFGLTLPEDTIRSLWIDDFRAGISVDQDVLDIAKALKAKGCVLGVISNTIHEHAVILRELGVYDPFEHVVLSHEVGMTKDAVDIFEHAVVRAGTKPQEAIFIDDVQTFVDCAKRAGLHGILFKGAERLSADLNVLSMA
ncbi:MAG: HAD-IA family hydrolase [Oligoflexia bacterium]|nr:HAD-IA family hydrolase [Oligoflexia bacterium]